ncbi:hypothetical protein HYDPIDRAFT_110460 [Hydnomerulius pinastri MD-312]|nr:hypothetical protein HYDPIDRAFT_110460 [Hydnomerulius pinastri MD-312]
MSNANTFTDPSAPPIDLTERIIRLDQHHCDGGAFGDIWRCLLVKSPEALPVAVKALRFSLTSSHMLDENGIFPKGFRRELGIWKRLDHPNVVPFLGIATGFGPHPSLVSMWMPNGTLGKFVAQQGVELGIIDRLRLIENVASGLQYLHSFSVIHGDLTSNNILIDEQSRARLVDFGFATVVGQLPGALNYLQRSTQRPGATRWAAPEQFQLEDDEIFHPTMKSDIYSFGSIMVQTLSGKEPWAEIKNEINVVRHLLQGRNPTRPSVLPIDDRHWEFIQKCWLPVEERLSTSDVVAGVSGFLAEMQPSTQLPAVDPVEEAISQPVPVTPLPLPPAPKPRRLGDPR